MAKRLFSSESVTEGIRTRSPTRSATASWMPCSLGRGVPRAVETLVTTGLVVVAGEVDTRTYVDIPRVVRKCILDIGYDPPTRIRRPIMRGVGVAGPSVARHPAKASTTPGRAVRAQRRPSGRARCRRSGADVRVRMYGYPRTDAAAHRAGPAPEQAVDRGAQAGGDPFICGPTGKVQVTIEYDGTKPVAVNTVVVSSQHIEDIDLDTLLAPDIEEFVIQPELAGLELATDGVRALVNPTGRFVDGGPAADAGVTGRKIIVDTYGGMARRRGAFSGKDPSKVDRSASYAMRWVPRTSSRRGWQPAARCKCHMRSVRPTQWGCSSRLTEPA